MLLQMLTQAGLVALLSLLAAMLPLVAGIAYAVGPSERRLMLLRPISLVAIFGSMAGTLSGFINVLRMMGIAQTPVEPRIVAISLAESLVPLFVAFGCLTVAWLGVAVGLRRVEWGSGHESRVA